MPKLHAMIWFIGLALVATGAPSFAGCNSGSAWKTAVLGSAGCQAEAYGQDALAVGDGAKAVGDDATALGTRALALGWQSTTVGQASESPDGAAGATSVGWIAGRYGLGPYATAIGFDPQAAGGNSVALGGGANLSYQGPRANGYRSIAVGQKSLSGDFGTSLGFNTTTVFAATAIGTDALANGNSSSAFGRFSKASALNATALGVSATATQARSVALGSSSIANVADVVSVGNGTYRRRIVNVAAAANGTDVPNLAQVKSLIAAATAVPASANLSRAALNINRAVDTRDELRDLRGLVAGLQQRIAELERQTGVWGVD